MTGSVSRAREALIFFVARRLREHQSIPIHQLALGSAVTGATALPVTQGRTRSGRGVGRAEGTNT